MDHIEWDLLSPLTPEAFAIKLCADIGLTGEAAPLIAHAMHEEILKHKKDAIEWGMIGGDAGSTSNGRDALEDDKRDKSGLGLVKDKTGLGLGPGAWGRAPRDGLGRGPRALKSVWKDWNDTEEYATRFEVLSLEEVERREIERERASRYVAEYRLGQNYSLKMLKTDDCVARHRNFSSARRVDGGKESGAFSLLRPLCRSFARSTLLSYSVIAFFHIRLPYQTQEPCLRRLAVLYARLAIRYL